MPQQNKNICPIKSTLKLPRELIPDSQFPPAETCGPCFRGGKNAYSFPQPGWTPICGKWPNLRLAATNLLSKWSLSAWCQFVIAPDRATEQRREKNQSAHQPPPTGCNLTSCNSSNTVQEHNCVTDKTISTTIIWHHGNMGWSSKFQWQLLSLGCLVLGQSWL